MENSTQNQDKGGSDSHADVVKKSMENSAFYNNKINQIHQLLIGLTISDAEHILLCAKHKLNGAFAKHTIVTQELLEKSKTLNSQTISDAVL